MYQKNLFALLVKDNDYVSTPYVSEKQDLLTPILEDTARKYFIKELMLGAKLVFSSNEKIEIRLNNKIVGEVVVEKIQTKLLK